MTTLLEKAFTEVSQLPPQEQDAVAAIILDEIDSERRWDELFSRSQDQLGRLADEALQEFLEGKTIPWDEDQT